ncbi:hypothetical protein ZWY2020_011107 [Hordeum vulgare]|nr:hypothetical protein ZWY2020_011107 [Hordeum vulgare]
MDKDTETQFASAGAEEREGDDRGVPRRGSPLHAAAHTPAHTTSSRRRNPDMTKDARPLWPQLRGLDEAIEDDEGGEADVMDVIDVEITVPNITLPKEITSWSRNDDEGSRVDVSVITNIKPVEFEDVQFKSDDDTDDDEAYVNDGHIAPLGEEELDDDEGFFV